MYYWPSYLLIFLGILAASPLIISRVPSAKGYMDRYMIPYQGWVGVISFIGGIFALIGFIRMNPIQILQSGVIGIFNFIFILGAILLLITMGFLFGVGLAKPFIKDVKAQEKINLLVNKLLPVQSILGVVSIVVGILIEVLGHIRSPSP